MYSIRGNITLANALGVCAPASYRLMNLSSNAMDENLNRLL